MQLILTLIAFVVLATTAPAAGGSQQSDAFRLTSTDVASGTFAPEHIYNGFGCTGGNVSPQLSWSGAPEGTRSFVVTVYDPDAPTGSGFWHWVVANIPASTSSLPRGASGTPNLPSGAMETRTDFGTVGYGGPCPPAGDPPHRYIFTIHALKVEKIDVAADTPAALVGFMTHMNRVGQASFTARHGR